MRAFNTLPVPVIQAASLSKDALKRLTWIDWYSSHGKNAELACRHFGISKSVFYRWLNRFDKTNLKTLEYEFLHYRALLPELEEVINICWEFNDHYNKKRFHQALAYKTPEEYVRILQEKKGGEPFFI